MTKASEIPDALLARVATLYVGSPALPIAFPNVPFDPATDAPDGRYLEVGYFRNAPAWEGVASGIVDQGLLVISVIYGKDAGVIGVNEAAQEVADHFPKAAVYDSGSTRVKISKEAVIGSPLHEGDKTIVPVTISWTA